MNNKRLAEIIKDPGIATDKEVKQIKTYSEEYSYSPFLKVLQARLDHLHNKKDKAKSLTKAAIYIADRSILKDFITKDKFPKAASEDTLVQEKTTKEKKADKSVDDPNKKDKTRDKERLKKDPEVLSKEEVAEPARKEGDQDVGAVTDKVELQDAETMTDEKWESDAQIETGAVESSDGDVQSLEKQEEQSSGEQEEKQEAVIEEQEKEYEPAADKQKIEYEPAAKDQEKAHETSTEEKQKESKTDTEQDKDHEPAAKGNVPAAKEKEIEQEPAADEKVAEQEVSEEDSEKKEETPTEDPEQELKGKSSSLSKEIMDNISELKKHKASLLNLLNIGSSDKSSPGDSKPEKSSKKEKSKQKAGKKDKKKGSGDKTIKSEKIDPKVSQPMDVPENKDYPDYEEEDPLVIKDFLTRLEESNPTPKKKLKKEEQEKLIEKFIQSDPQMKNVRSSKELAEKKDLSAHSVKFRDDIISENLACIMIKQGKHEKAIDIYKKLIWKFPQKKAYFATQIEELKKKLKK